MTDLNTPDDWWNEGFDDFFEGAPPVLLKKTPEWIRYYDGWVAGQAYRNAMKEPTND